MRLSFHRGRDLPGPLADAGTYERGGQAWLLGGETPAESDRVLQVELGR